MKVNFFIIISYNFQKHILMTRHIKTKILSVFIFSVLLFTQVQNHEEQYNEEGFEQMNTQQQMQRQHQQEMSMKQTACLVLSRYHSNAHKQMLDQIIQSLRPEDQQAYINKVYAVAVLECLPKINLQEAQQFFIQNDHFNPASMFYIYDGFDYSEVANDLQTLTPEQKSVIKFIKQFDEQMAVRRQEKQAQEKDSGQSSQYEMTIMGFGAKDFGTTAKVIYLAIFSLIVGGGLWYGFKNLHNSQNPNIGKKKKKNKEK